MNKLLITLILITFTTSTLPNVDYAHTEPYVEFDWIDEDKKSLKIEFEDALPNNDYYCYLYNNSNYCPGTGKCGKTPRTITCEYEGDKCKADGDNPATKYYYQVVCSENTELKKIEEVNSAIYTSPENYIQPEITVAVKGGSYIKYSFILLLSLLVL